MKKACFSIKNILIYQVLLQHDPDNVSERNFFLLLTDLCFDSALWHPSQLSLSPDLPLVLVEPRDGWVPEAIYQSFVCNYTGKEEKTKIKNEGNDKIKENTMFFSSILCKNFLFQITFLPAGAVFQYIQKRQRRITNITASFLQNEWKIIQHL